jgi:hypothetical protein
MNNDTTILLDNEKFKQFIDDKETNSVFLLATVQMQNFKNMFKILKNVFKSVTLKICSVGIILYKCEWSKTSKVKAGEISSLFYLSGIFDKTPLILGDRCEKYNCVDTIFVNLDTSELERINKDITKDCFMYMFINKDNYNTETNTASSIHCYIINEHENENENENKNENKNNMILIEKIINC